MRSLIKFQNKLHEEQNEASQISAEKLPLLEASVNVYLDGDHDFEFKKSNPKTPQPEISEMPCEDQY